ncbi:hypothetical protein ACGF8B_27730 [Streptomyces sp. NPDC047917]|uniref:hypothetical protein n=1 Tax=Streptomyces sp. NPDC047917 TaxID=3365491 RepID=UPI003712F627
MFALMVGVVVAGFGICLAANLWNLADRIFSYYSCRVSMGSATAGTFRLVGGGWVLVGLFWIATALPEVFQAADRV